MTERRGHDEYPIAKGLVVGGALAAAALLVAAPASASPPVAFSATFQNTSSVITASRRSRPQYLRQPDRAGCLCRRFEVCRRAHRRGNPSRWDAQRQGSRRLHLHAHRHRAFGHDRPAVLATGDASGSVSGRFTFADGTGGLANLHGVGTFESSNGSSGSFSAFTTSIRNVANARALALGVKMVVPPCGQASR